MHHQLSTRLRGVAMGSGAGGTPRLGDVEDAKHITPAYGLSTAGLVVIRYQGTTCGKGVPHDVVSRYRASTSVNTTSARPRSVLHVPCSFHSLYIGAEMTAIITIQTSPDHSVEVVHEQANDAGEFVEIKRETIPVGTTHVVASYERHRVLISTVINPVVEEVEEAQHEHLKEATLEEMHPWLQTDQETEDDPNPDNNEQDGEV